MHLILGDSPFFWNSEPMSPHFCCSPLDSTHHLRTSVLADGWVVRRKESRWNYYYTTDLLYLLSYSPLLSWCCNSWDPSTSWGHLTPLLETWWRNQRRADFSLRILPKKIIWIRTFPAKSRLHSVNVERNVWLKMLTYFSYMEIKLF